MVPPNAPPSSAATGSSQNLGDSPLDAADAAASCTAAIAEPVILRGDRPPIWRAPHFMWQVRGQLEQILGLGRCGRDRRLPGHHDARLARPAARGADSSRPRPSRRTCRASRAERLLDRLKIPRADRGWINRPCAARTSTTPRSSRIDYRTGDVRAYVGSARLLPRRPARAGGSTRSSTPRASAARQPGSAFKPVALRDGVRAQGADARARCCSTSRPTSTARQHWAPKDADRPRARAGPRAPRAPDVAQHPGDPGPRAGRQRRGRRRRRRSWASRFTGGKQGVPARPGWRARSARSRSGRSTSSSAYGTLANGGVHEPTRMILEIRGPDGKTVWKAPDAGQRAMSAASAYLVTDILKGNTEPAPRTRSGPRSSQLRNGPRGTRRPAAVKTGTANDAPRPRDVRLPAAAEAIRRRRRWAVGVWMGNSDHSMPRASDPAISLTAAAPLWRSFVRQLTNGEPVAGLRAARAASCRATIDAWSGGKPGPWTRRPAPSCSAPGRSRARKRRSTAGLLYSPSCGTWAVDPRQGRARPASVGRRRRELARPRRSRRRASAGLRLANRVLLGPDGLGRAAHRCLLRPLARPRERAWERPWPRSRSRAARAGTGAGWPARTAASQPGPRAQAASPAHAHDRNAELMPSQTSVTRPQEAPS